MKILCFESGGTKLVAALAGKGGELLARDLILRRPEQDAHETCEQFIEMGKRLLAHDSTAISAVGFGFGGTFDRRQRRLAHCFHEDGWSDVDLIARLEKTFTVPVFAENDCNLAALAEAWLGVRRIEETLLYITVGTGIGGGLVHQGQLVELGRAGEAEIGHVIVDPKGPGCACGNRGCLETLCSGPGLETLSERLSGRPIPAKVLMELLRSGDREADRITTNAADLFACALAPAINLLAPSEIVFGGGVMLRNTLLLEKIKAATLPMVFPPFRRLRPRFSLSQLQEDVVCCGAALYAEQRLGQLEDSGNIL
jgi:glucokinase